MPSRSSLHIDGRNTGIVVVSAGSTGMWRLIGHGQVSDMVNLSRARDAALFWARSGGFKTGEGHSVSWMPVGLRRTATGTELRLAG